VDERRSPYRLAALAGLCEVVLPLVRPVNRRELESPPLHFFAEFVGIWSAFPGCSGWPIGIFCFARAEVFGKRLASRRAAAVLHPRPARPMRSARLCLANPVHSGRLAWLVRSDKLATSCGRRTGAGGRPGRAPERRWPCARDVAVKEAQEVPLSKPRQRGGGGLANAQSSRQSPGAAD
jgi:hypothetical protein